MGFDRRVVRRDEASPSGIAGPRGRNVDARLLALTIRRSPGLLLSTSRSTSSFCAAGSISSIHCPIKIRLLALPRTFLSRRKLTQETRESSLLIRTPRVLGTRTQRVRRSHRSLRQSELPFKTWGGVRRGAGRKRTGERARVSHRVRPDHGARHPLHVTLRLRPGLPTLRRRTTRGVIAGAFHSGRERFGFRLTHFSLQSNHIHLIAEAEDRRGLSRGLQGLMVRTARALNRLWNRRGAVFSDRFHSRTLRTPLEVRRALVYVLNNARHHGLRLLGIDPFSSGAWFDGWKSISPVRSESPATRPRTWLLCRGWRLHGGIGVDESPACLPPG